MDPYTLSHDYSTEPDHAHQLSPIKGGRYTAVLHGPEGDVEVGDLHCELEPLMWGEHPTTITHSGWAPTAEQVEQLESGAHVRLTVWQHPIPPLAVSIEAPICQHCGEPMKWDPDERGYVCSDVTLAPERKADAVEDALAAAKRDFTAAEDPDPDGDTAASLPEAHPEDDAPESG